MCSWGAHGARSTKPSIGRKNGQKLCDLGVNVRLCACMPALTPNPLSHQKNLAKITNIFDIQQRSTGLIARKVFSSNLAHISTCSCSSCINIQLASITNI